MPKFKKNMHWMSKIVGLKPIGEFTGVLEKLVENT